MSAEELFKNKVLTTSFQASKPAVLGGSGEFITLDFTVVITGGATEVQYYLEFTPDDPLAAATNWWREVAEEDTGGGQVDMPLVVRSLRANGGANLGNGTHRVTMQFQRRYKGCYRIQAAIVVGGGAATLTAEDKLAGPVRGGS